MNNSENKLQEVVRRIKENKKQHRRIRLYMTILSCVVFLLVFWQLRGTGIALLRDSAGVATSTDAEKKEIHGEPEDIRESGTVTAEKDKENETGRNINDEKIDSKTSDKADDILEDEKLNTKETSSEETEEASEEESEEPEKVEYESESESGIRVRISASTDAFPEGTDVRVEDVPEDMAMEIAEAGVAELNSTDGAEPADDEETDDEEPDVSTAGDAEAVEAETLEQEVEIHSAVGVDITFISPEGEEIEPKEGSSVDVSIMLPEEAKIENENLCLLHQVDEETIEHIEDAKVEDEKVVFTTESFSIYVMTNLGPVDKDKVHETLRPDEYHDVYFGPAVEWWEEKPVYYPNGNYDNDSPYVLHVGESVTLIGIGTANNMTSEWDRDHEGNPRENIIDIQSGPIVETLENGQLKVTKTYVARSVGSGVIHYGDENFYYKVKEKEEGTHSDIEIADGGYLNETSITYDDNGNMIKTTIVYDTIVMDVDHCEVYDGESEPNMLALYTSDYYENFGTPGSTQYEITSAWNALKPELNMPRFEIEKADHVMFYLKMGFFPTKIITSINNGEEMVRNLSEGEYPPVLPDDIYVFRMEKRSLIDALNKCPNHTGFDFNLRYSKASCVLFAKKVLKGEDLSDQNRFSFEVLDEKGNRVKDSDGTDIVAQNDLNGDIVFPQIDYETEGTYKYKIREIVPDTDDALVYDRHISNVTVVVNRNANGDLYVDSINYEDNKIPEFTNYVKYTLPSTGGIGIYPYIILGIILCGASLLLLILTRRRGSG